MINDRDLQPGMVAWGTKLGNQVFFQLHVPTDDSEVRRVLADTRSIFRITNPGIEYYSLGFTKTQTVFTKYLSIYDWGNRDGGYLAVSLFVPHGWEHKKYGGMLEFIDLLMTTYTDRYLDTNSYRIVKVAEDVELFKGLLKSEDFSKLQVSWDPLYNGIMPTGRFMGKFISSASELSSFFNDPYRDALKEYQLTFFVSDQFRNLNMTALQIREEIPTQERYELRFVVDENDRIKSREPRSVEVDGKRVSDLRNTRLHAQNAVSFEVQGFDNQELRYQFTIKELVNSIRGDTGIIADKYCTLTLKRVKTENDILEILIRLEPKVYKVKLVVRDFQGAPVQASVKISDEKFHGDTDPLGCYTISAFKLQNIHIDITSIGHETAQATINESQLRAGTDIHVRLKRNTDTNTIDTQQKRQAEHEFKADEAKSHHYRDSRLLTTAGAVPAKIKSRPFRKALIISSIIISTMAIVYFITPFLPIISSSNRQPHPYQKELESIIKIVNSKNASADELKKLDGYIEGIANQRQQSANSNGKQFADLSFRSLKAGLTVAQQDTLAALEDRLREIKKAKSDAAKSNDLQERLNAVIDFANAANFETDTIKKQESNLKDILSAAEKNQMKLSYNKFQGTAGNVTKKTLENRLKLMMDFGSTRWSINPKNKKKLKNENDILKAKCKLANLWKVGNFSVVQKKEIEDWAKANKMAEVDNNKKWSVELWMKDSCD